MNKTSLKPEKTNVSQNTLAKQAKFRLKNRKYPVEVMSNPLKGSNKESKTSTSHGSKTKIHNKMYEPKNERKAKEKKASEHDGWW